MGLSEPRMGTTLTTCLMAAMDHSTVRKKYAMGATVPEVPLDDLHKHHHAFARTDGTQFDVRIGPNYEKYVERLRQKARLTLLMG